MRRVDADALPHRLPARSRATSLALIVATVALGLASRRHPVLAPEFGKYPGDALWAAMIVFAGGLLRPRASSVAVSSFAATVCVAVECGKLIPAPWLVAARDTTVGGLVLGHVFSVANLVAYAIGIAGAVAIDRLRRAAESHVRP